MARRKTVHKTHIKGTGSVDYQEVWRVFECANPKCAQLMKVSEDDVDVTTYKHKCPICGQETEPTTIMRAPRWKYCRVCEMLQLMEGEPHFHRHSRMKSGYQLECKYCKNERINPQLNPLRTADQHRESSERRRLYGFLAGESVKSDAKAIYEKFSSKCFRCSKELSYPEGHLDHTLPAKLFWPLSTGATLLCAECNNLKHEKWPSEVYSEPQLRKLAVLTSIPYAVLAGTPKLNPQALKRLKDNVDAFIERWVRYPDEIKKIRKLIIDMTGEDIFAFARNVPEFLEDGP